MILKVAVTKRGAMPSCASEIVTAKIVIAHLPMPARRPGYYCSLNTFILTSSLLTEHDPCSNTNIITQLQIL
jgi:hypothetical protein